MWGFHKAEAVERVHSRFCKTVLRLKSSTVNYFVYGELDRAPPIIERHLRILKYWTKIISRKLNPLVCSMYRFMYQKCEMQRKVVNWASLVKKLLNDLGLSQVWQQQSCGDTNLFLKICKQRLRHHFLQSWVSDVNNSETATFYKHFRMTPNYSVILEKIDINKYKYCFLKFITRNHNLAVVAGRWHKPRPIPFNERFCIACDTQQLEDEYYLILDCKMYHDLRQRYIPKFYWKKPSMDKFVKLFSCTKKKTLVDLSIFIFKAMCIRNIS